MAGKDASALTGTRRAGSLGAALAGSLAVHGIAVAAVIALGRANLPEPLPMITVEIVAHASPGSGTRPAIKGADRPAPGSSRAAAPPSAERSEAAKAPAEPPPARIDPPQRQARPAAPAQAVKTAEPPRDRAPAEAVVPPPRPKPPPEPRPAASNSPGPKPPVSKRVLRETAEAARRKTETARIPSSAALTTGAASAYSPPRVGGGSAGNPMPTYPERARERGIEGRVVLAVRVGADGRALAVKIDRSSGAAELDRAAADAVRRWRFEPARQGGLAVEGTVSVPIRFRLIEN